MTEEGLTPVLIEAGIREEDVLSNKDRNQQEVGQIVG